MNTLRAIWNFDFTNAPAFLTDTRWVRLSIWTIAVGFAFVTVMVFSAVPGTTQVTLSNFDEIKALYQTDKTASFRQLLPYIWLGVAVLAVVTRSLTIISSYYLSVKKLGESKFNFYFSTFITTFLIGTATMIILSLIGWLAVMTGHNADWVGSLVQLSAAKINQWVSTLIPFTLGLDSYVLSFFLTLFLSYLPGYLVHSLCHRSRFFWLIAHRPHHCPDFLFPLAAPNNNIAVLEFLLAIPGVIFFIVVSGMIYHEPLTLELAIWFTTGLVIESFNHSYAHYDFAYRNPVVRFMSSLFGGNGVYHLVHHSAYKEDQNVNFGGAPFLFWDRLFGTYRKPYPEAPPIGLTDQPPIDMSPMKIVFNGFSQIWYEWKMNKDWRTRFMIIFGGVFYKPPVTKDFLVISPKV
jgi:sterol desaturase/sphingolipid hydroxylase (fatty acid hydroxylase superfamily)